MRLLDSRHQLVVVTILGSICQFSCATGRDHERAAEEPAELVTTSAQSDSGYSTDIVAIDGQAKHGSSFTLRPGRHTVEVEGTCTPRNGNGGLVAGVAVFNPLAAAGVALGTAIAGSRNALHSGRLMACFIARPSHTYEVRTFGEGGVWKIEVIDQTTTFDVKSPCKSAAKTIEQVPPRRSFREPLE